MVTDGNASTQFQPGNQLAVGHGAPAGNANAFKHGGKSRRALTIGKLPPSCNWIANRVSALRRELERATTDVHGDVSLKAGLYINSALRHEQAALLAQRWLRLNGGSMSHGERLSYLQ